MADIFLAYAREDRALAERIAQLLATEGFNVAWDIEIEPGDQWDEYIERTITEAKAAVVLWSKASVKSRWVRDEARMAEAQSKYVPVSIEDAPFPIGLGGVQAANLIGWRGDASHSDWRKLTAALVARCRGRGAPAPIPAQPRAQKPRGGGALLLFLSALGAIAVTAFLFSRPFSPPWAAPPHPVWSLRLAGSNTIGADLAGELADAFLREDRAFAGGATSRVQGPNQAEQLGVNERVVRARRADGGFVQIRIAAHGSNTAPCALASGEADIGMMSHEWPGAPACDIASLGDLRDPARSAETMIGLDGVAIIVHAANRLASIDRPTLRRIYCGEISDWSALGLAPGAIHLHRRNDDSGTFDVFRERVLINSSGRACAVPANAAAHEDSEALIAAVAADANAIGFVGAGPVTHAHNREIKVLQVRDSESTGAFPPTPFSIRSGDYPLARRLFFYTPPNADGEMQALQSAFIAFARSERGQRIVENAGFVSLSQHRPEAEDRAAWFVGAPADYVEALRGAEKQDLTLRFRFASDDLDAQALRDLAEIGQRAEGRSVILAGHADSVGPAAFNDSLSLGRANAAARALARHGVRPARVLGFGERVLRRFPDDTAARRSENRRVEIWFAAQQGS